MALIWLPVATVAVARPPVPWIVASDWDDTIKAGGHGRLLGIRGIGRRIQGTYPGMVALLAELDPCWSGRSLLSTQPSFQIWSAKPFGSKRQDSCSPPLHRRPVTRHGSIWAGLGWLLSNRMPACRLVRDSTREWCRERSGCALGEDKYKTFCREAAQADERTEIIFFGDSAQGDAHAACQMVDDTQYGSRAWIFLHDLTRCTDPGLPPSHDDKRIAVRQPFQRRCEGKPCPVGCGRVTYYKTVPEAALVLAQYGFLSRDSLRFVVLATRRELSMLQVSPDEATLGRLRRGGRRALSYDELVHDDLDKCEALLRTERFWQDVGGSGSKDANQVRAMATAELTTAAQMPSKIRMSQSAKERARRAIQFKEAALHDLKSSR